VTADLDRLLDDAGRSGAPVDADALWERGRRRRRWRRTGVTGSVVAVLAAAAMVVPGLLPTPSPEVDPLGRAPLDAPEGGERDAGPEIEREPYREPVEPPVLEPYRPDPDTDPVPVRPQVQAPAPEPDPALVASPCAPHADRADEVFLDVAAPVDGQVVAGRIGLVGCANVFEATVRYRLTEGDVVHLDGFTTATCGSGCVGEFRAPIDVPAGTGPLTLEVFWEDAEDGRERDVVTLELRRPA